VVRFGVRSERALREAFADALYSAVDGRDLVLDTGFGPDAERELIGLALARAGPDVEARVAEARRVFDVETAARPQQSFYADAARLVLTRMAECTAAEWLDVHADALESAQAHRESRRAWLDRLTRLDPDDDEAVVDVVSAVANSAFGARVDADFAGGADALSALFDADVVPETLPGESNDRPGALLLCRSPEPLASLRLAAELGYVAIDPDVLIAYHPRTASGVDGEVRHDVVLWTVMSIGYVVEHRLDVVVQTAAEEPEQTAEVAAVFAEAGYRVAVHPESLDVEPELPERPDEAVDVAVPGDEP
jgi:hypothetical protein